MTRLKSEMLVSAAMRYAAAELIDCVLVRRGDGDAGAIFLHMDVLDGRHKLLARSLDFDGVYSWRSITGGGANGTGWVDFGIFFGYTLSEELISKINAALQRLKDGTYGFCEETGEPIGLKRLIARPVATLSIESQEKHERNEKIFVED
mgnify:CR=1 FL=1